ncbi:pseudouridine-5'-phosphatase-like [Bacillus rossius redtenbacheri]|uniref:pseudouridine-5'-phosphatase-like n=1 Tax=Bacillus rossius redtenbacheri TaxID=93214 RepID=UPI002FDD011B
MPDFKPVTHVIFDCDGLLLDSETMYEQIYSELASVHGKEFTWELRMTLLGVPEADSSVILVEKLELPITSDEANDYLRQRERELLPTVGLMPGVDRLVRHLVANEVPIAIATSSSIESMELKMSAHGDFWSLFNHTVTASDLAAIRGKPAPDIFLMCARRFPATPRPEACLVLEAEPNGVLGALAAGMQVVMVPDPRIPEAERPATLVLSSVEEFQPQLFGLPAL